MTFFANHTALDRPSSLPADIGHASRICLPTWRNFRRMVSRCAHYEGQDVLNEIDGVDLLQLEPTRSFALGSRLQGSLLWRNLWNGLAHVNPGLRPVRLTRRYDLFMVMCQSAWDLPFVNAVSNWKENCGVSICWLDEIWSGMIPKLKGVLHALRKFDHVVVGISGSAKVLGDWIGRPCHFVPSAVDALRFSPFPNPPEKSIDAYSIGRKWTGVHQSLLAMAAQREIFYVYDTAMDAGNTQPQDYRQHRDLLANMAKRSRCFLVAPAKVDARQETQGQSEVGYRYFEGAMAGAAMIGQAPTCDAFRELFDWPDPVLEIKTDGSDVARVLRELAADPERLRAIGRRNARQALLRHDWVHRWKQVLAIAGLKPTPAMDARERQLQQMAQLADTHG